MFSDAFADTYGALRDSYIIQGKVHVFRCFCRYGRWEPVRMLALVVQQSGTKRRGYPSSGEDIGDIKTNANMVDILGKSNIEGIENIRNFENIETIEEIWNRDIK